MSRLKSFVKATLRVLLYPLRCWMHRGSRSTDTVRSVKQMPNDRFLPEVRRVLREGHTATIIVKGYSMRPFLEHCRDRVVLKAVNEPQVGDAVLAEIAPGRFVLHRVIRRDASRLTLMGDGNLGDGKQSGVEHCTVADVAGRVITYVYPWGQLAADDARLCRRIRRWRHCLPLRRYLLFIYRILLN